MDFVRARQPDQKNQRLESILRAAGSLLESSEFEEISMREIAERAGMGKASLYHYFATKEEVFLELFLVDLGAWIGEFDDRVSRLRKPNVERVAAILAKLMIEHERCSRLMAILSGILERNIGSDKLASFKTRILHPMGQLMGILCRALPELGEARASEFLIQFHAMIGGLWPLAHPNENLQEALEAEHLQMFRVDFESQCKAIVIKLLS